METETIEGRVLDVLRDVLALEQEETIVMDVSITDELAPDSLDQMRLYMALEDEFQETIPEEKMAQIKTVRDIVVYIEANSRGR